MTQNYKLNGEDYIKYESTDLDFIGIIKLITDHVEELRSVISEYYNRIALLEEANGSICWGKPMTDKLKPILRKAFESYYQYLDEGTGCHNAIIELKTAIDLAIEEIEEKDRELQAKRLKIVEMYLKLGQARTENE